MTVERVLAELEKNMSEVLRVSLGEYNGRQVVDLRCWTRPDGKPTKKGVTFGVGLLPQVISALLEAEKVLAGEGNEASR